MQQESISAGNSEPEANEDHQRQALRPEDVPNAVLRRLIEEVAHESISDISAYNRAHNRHNRSR